MHHAQARLATGKATSLAQLGLATQLIREGMIRADDRRQPDRAPEIATWAKIEAHAIIVSEEAIPLRGLRSRATACIPVYIRDDLQTTGDGKGRRFTARGETNRSQAKRARGDA